MPGAHKIGAAISGARIAGGNFMDITLFLIKMRILDLGLEGPDLICEGGQAAIEP